MPKPIRQKPHRLPPAAYYGEVTISITANIQNRKSLFLDSNVVTTFIEELALRARKCDSNIPIYCFMPDHLHLLIRGLTNHSRPKQAIEDFKTETGIWLAKHAPDFEWQDRYYDHIIRSTEDWKAQARYIAQNPVRANLAEHPTTYPHTGSIGYDINDILYDANN